MYEDFRDGKKIQQFIIISESKSDKNWWLRFHCSMDKFKNDGPCISSSFHSYKPITSTLPVKLWNAFEMHSCCKAFFELYGYNTDITVYEGWNALRIVTKDFSPLKAFFRGRDLWRPVSEQPRQSASYLRAIVAFCHLIWSWPLKWPPTLWLNGLFQPPQPLSWPPLGAVENKDH